MIAYLTYALVLLAVGAYVVLDGYDLGVGILSLFDRSDDRRREYNELIATAWDANESWIVLAGVCLWAGLPSVYATVLSGVYIPLIAMLMSIIVRGVGLEFQSASPVFRRRWARLFGIASLGVTVCQGLIIGAVLSGIRQRGGVFHGAALDWLTPYSVLCALGLIALYLLLGSAWLQDKTEGVAHERAGRIGRPLVGFVLAFSLILGFGLEVADPQRFQFDQPLRATLFGIAIAVAACCGAVAWYAFERRPDWRPFVAVVVAVVAGLLAVVAATAPVIVPRALTVDEASSPHGSQVFLVVGVGLCMPIVLTYNIYAWWTFRGKFREPVEEPLPAPRPAVSLASAIATTAPSAVGTAARQSRPERRLSAASILGGVRRIALILLGLLVAVVCQDIFGGESEWIGRIGVLLTCIIALAAWIMSDRKSARRGEFDYEQASER